MLSTADILNASILIVDDQEANVRLREQLPGEAGFLNEPAALRVRARAQRGS
jgi:hypothetical protein